MVGKQKRRSSKRVQKNTGRGQKGKPKTLGRVRKKISPSEIKKQQTVFARFLKKQKPTITKDPLSIPSRYTNPEDIEVTGLIASIFAFGSVQVFLPLLDAFHDLWGPHPYTYIKEGRFEEDRAWKTFYYRWYRPEDIVALLQSLQSLLHTHGSLQDHAHRIYDHSESFETFLCVYAADLRGHIMQNRDTRGTRFMIPDPRKKSTMKRLLMFLRWMSNPKGPDFGLWTFIDPTNLWIALDTHMAQYARQFGWTSDTQDHLRTVQEVSEVISKIYPQDPMHIDFVLTQYGITGKCLHRYKQHLCEPCDLREICHIYKKSSSSGVLTE